MRREAPACRPPSSERGGGKTGSAAQNLPRFSSTATTVLAARSEEEGFPMDLSHGLPEDLPDLPAGLAVSPAGLPDFPVDLPTFPVDLPTFPAGLPDLVADFFPRDLLGELT
jgi:hypothetical protein